MNHCKILRLSSKDVLGYVSKQGENHTTSTSFRASARVTLTTFLSSKPNRGPYAMRPSVVPPRLLVNRFPGLLLGKLGSCASTYQLPRLQSSDWMVEIASIPSHLKRFKFWIMHLVCKLPFKL